MIHYQLQCRQGHGFDGWFRDSAAFEAQAGRGLVACPTCADTGVTRALMAPALAKGRQVAPLPAPSPPPAPGPPDKPVTVAGGAPMPDHVRTMLQRLRAEVERHCDYVGPAFAEEARRIHSGESERRGIYGEATPDEAASLADDGIEVARIPWVPRADG
ncbi:MAG: DUF1178 family protein [Rhodospirillales bacterium]|nr:DUF1178 family protein [Rhodospirillales bacterium]